MKLGVLKEQGIHRVAFIPSAAKKLKALDLELYFEADAGLKSSIEDQEYLDQGWEKKERSWILSQSDILATVKPLEAEELNQLKSGSVYISMMKPYENSPVSQQVKGMDIKAFSMDMIPRSTLAQSVDILSSMASLAGYKAVILAAERLPKIFPMMMTAAGTIRPTKVLILGAGVAGLQAIATARRLGAIVEVFDVRPAVKEEVQSLGAKFVEVEGAQDSKDAGGYAIEQTEEYKQKQAKLIQERAAKSDIIITTAQLRGKPAPLLIQKDTLDRMKQGSVVIDLAASSGGNCAMTEDQKTVHYKGVQIIGNSELADDMPNVSSELFSNNMVNYLKFLIKDGSLDLQNEITSNSLIN